MGAREGQTLEAHGGYNIMQNVGEVEVKGMVVKNFVRNRVFIFLKRERGRFAFL